MTTFYLKAKEAKQIADGLAFCMSKEETRYYLNGVYIHAKQQKLFAVATDGHRIGRLWLYPQDETTSKEKPIDGDLGAIIPRTAVEWLGKIKLPKGSDKELVRFDFTDEKVALTLLPDSHTAVFTLIDGHYPDYERVIPSKRGETEVGFNALYLADIGKAARKLSDAYSAGVKLHIGSPSDPCVVTCDNERMLYVQMPMRV
jgi:DNA polymerase-3 subunit beta